MERVRSEMTERILNLTLEIIYLLTGENYIAFKLSDGLVAPSSMKNQSLDVGPSSTSQIHERKSKKKVQEVTKKIIELLTREVPIRCQDVTVCFSVEEWQYLEGHKDLYKDFMMEDQLLLTSPDGSNNRNPPEPERCTGPLHSLDATQEDLKIHQGYQDDNLINVKAEERYVRDKSCNEEKEIPAEISTDGSNNRNLPEICADTLYSQDSTQDDHKTSQDYQDDSLITIKEESDEACMRDDEPFNEEDEISPEICTAEAFSNRNRPERCTGPLYSKDCTLEGHKIPQEYQDDNLIIVKEETEAMYRRDDDQHKEEMPPEISTDGRYRRHNMEKHLFITADGEMEDNDSIIDLSEENTITTNFQTAPSGVDPLCDPSTHVGIFPDLTTAVSHHIPDGGGTFPCPECGVCFTERAELLSHQMTHMSDQPFMFSLQSVLNRRRGTPTLEKPYSCFQCGKCFSLKSSLLTHEKAHTKSKPYSCLECGKSFSERSAFLIHERIHTAEKPFSCSECGKCFAQSGNLVAHQRIHTGEKPFSCPDCGECFSRKSSLVRHRKLHTGEKPYTCDICGKSFTQRNTLVSHQRTHTGDRLFSCSKCGKQFAKKSSLMYHLTSHRRIEGPTLECGS